MNRIYIITICLFLFPFSKIYSQKTITWIESFKEFRDAVSRSDKSKVKSFIDFPILNDHNEIWYLVYGGNDKALKLLSDKMKPFNEKDFDKYFDKLFPKTFVKSILKIKSLALYNTEESETIELKDGNTTYKMYAVYNSKENTLTLNMAYIKSVKTKDGNGKQIQEREEHNVMYTFNILKTGKLKFNQVRLAG